MSKSIKLSPKYGLNPTVPVCFFCGEPTDEVVLMGRLKGDKEAPKNLVLNYVPCKKCQEMFSGGILMVGVTTVQPDDGRPPIQGPYYPTGSYIVGTEPFIRRLYDPGYAESIIKEGKCLVDQEVLEELQRLHEQACGETDG